MLYDKKWGLDEVSKGLLKAAEYIEEHGWCQRMTFNERGESCLSFALDKAFGIDTSFDEYRLKVEARNRLMKPILEVMTENVACIINWNDAKGRTKEEVINLLREVAYQKD